MVHLEMVSPRNYHFSWCYSLSYRGGNPGWSSRLHPGVFRVAPPQPNVPNRCQKPRLGMQLGLTEGLVSFGDVVPLCGFFGGLGLRPPLWRFETSDIDLVQISWVPHTTDYWPPKGKLLNLPPQNVPHLGAYASVPMDPSWGLRI